MFAHSNARALGKVDFSKERMGRMERRDFLKIMGGAVGGLAFGTVFSSTKLKPTSVGDQAWARVRKHHMRMPHVRSAFAESELTKALDSLNA